MRYFILILFLIFSCSSKKDIILVQDYKTLNESNLEYDQIKIQVDDILKLKYIHKMLSYTII